MCKRESMGGAAPFEPGLEPDPSLSGLRSSPEAVHAHLNSERALDLYENFVPLTWEHVVVIGGTGEIGQILQVIPYGASQTPGALIRWASGRESYWFLRDLRVLSD